MTYKPKITPHQILASYEAGDNLPALTAGVMDADNLERNASFIQEMHNIMTDFIDGASTEDCMERVKATYLNTSEWCDAETYVTESLETIDFGSVYALVNESIPGMFKVGFTKAIPRDRAAQLSRATGVPTPFKVLFSYDTINCREIESDIHNRLNVYRVNDGREFFKCDVVTLVSAFESAIKHEYKRNGFSMNGLVVRCSYLYNESQIARNNCQLLLSEPNKFFHPEQLEKTLVDGFPEESPA